VAFGISKENEQESLVMIRFDSISNLTDHEFLSGIIGPISSINKTRLSAIGYSGSTLERVEVFLQSGIKRIFILKSTLIKADWLSQRANDQVGREAELLIEPSLSGVWKCIQSPYVAFAKENGQIALLMDDVSDYLFPDIREPLDFKSEDIILNSLASLHAAFWESPDIKKMNWLATSYNYLEVFAPGDHESDRYAPPPEKIGNSMKTGWEMAFQILPAEIKDILIKPAVEIFEPWKELPVTLLHGDAKIANMAILPSGELVMFDWTYVGRGPCGIELGWYLAVNSTRLSCAKEDFINQYRSYLELYLRFIIEENTWTSIVDLAIITGARMMLWNKALGYQTGTQRGKDEWEWWVAQLERIII
jgi:thiamine kinase-like enzyme